MDETKPLTNAQAMNLLNQLTGQMGGRHEGHKRCGEFLYYIDGLKSELGCTRRKGHADDHRIRIRIIGRRGRKHVHWPNVKLMIAFAVAQ